MVGQGAIVRFFGFLTTAALSRILGPADFGIYSLVANTTSSVYSFVRFGTDAAIPVFMARSDETREALQQKGEILGAGLFLLLISAFVGSFVCIVFSAAIANSIFKRPVLQSWIALAAVFVVFQCLSQFLYCIVVGFQRFPQYAKIMATNAAIGMAVVVPLALVYGLTVAMLVLAITQILALTMLYLTVREILLFKRIQIRFVNFGTEARKLLEYGFPFYLSGLALIPSVYYAQGLLTQRGGIEVVGGLRVISALLSLLSFVPGAIAPVILNRLSSTASGSRKSFVLELCLLIKYSWIFAVITGMLAALLTPVLVLIISGEQYAQYVPAARLAIFSSMFTTVLGVVTNAALSMGRVTMILQYSVFQAIAFFTTAVLMLSNYGLEGYFIAEILGQSAALGLLFSRKNIRVTIFRQRWFRPVCLVSAIYAVTIGLTLVQPEPLKTSGLMVGLIIIVFLIYIAIIDQRERKALNRAIKKLCN